MLLGSFRRGQRISKRSTTTMKQRNKEQIRLIRRRRCRHQQVEIRWRKIWLGGQKSDGGGGVRQG